MSRGCLFCASGWSLESLGCTTLLPRLGCGCYLVVLVIPGMSEIQVIPGRFLCVHVVSWRTIVDDLEKHASRACLWRWADDPGDSVMGTESPGSFLSCAGAL